MPPRQVKSGRRVSHPPTDPTVGPVHAPPDATVTAESLRVLHDLPATFVHRVHVAVATPQVRHIAMRGSWSRSTSLFQQLPEPIVVRLLDSPLGSFLELPRFAHVDRCLVEAISERWWPTTHTFHFPDFELGLTPLDFYVLTGIEVGRPGRHPIPFDVSFEEFDSYSEQLPGLEPHSVSSGAVTLPFLYSYVTAHQGTQAMHTPVIRAFLLHLFGSAFFSNNRGTIRLGYLASLVDIEQLHSFDWGTTILGYLYVALDLYAVQRCKQLYGFWYILPFWFYEYMAVMHPRLIDEAISTPYIYFPRLRRWGPAMHLARSAQGVHNELMEARTQIDLRERGGIIRRPWQTYIDFMAPQQDHPLIFHSSLSRRRVCFQVPTCPFIWYLGERCWLQLYGLERIPSDPLPWDQMFGDIQVGSSYIADMRAAGWVDGEPFTVPGDFDAYWARVAPRAYALPDYIRGLNSDHIGPSSVAGRFPVHPPTFAPVSSQFTQSGALDPPPHIFRAYDVQGQIVEIPLHYPDVDPPGVPSAGLYHPHQYSLYMDHDRRILAAFERMTLEYTQLMYQSLHGALAQQQAQYEAQIASLQTQLQQQGTGDGSHTDDAFDDVNDDSSDGAGSDAMPID